MATARKEYEMLRRFIDKYRSEIARGQPVKVEVRDPTDYRSLKVKAIVSEDLMPDSDILWIKNLREDRWPNPWHIRIMEELDEDEVVLSTPVIW